MSAVSTPAATLAQFPNTIPIDISGRGWPRKCLRQIPENTSIIAMVPIGTTEVDIYYRYLTQPGSSRPTENWVCRTRKFNAATGQIGASVDPVERIDPSQYEAQPGKYPDLVEDLGKGLAKFGKIGLAILVGLIALLAGAAVFGLARR